MLTAAQVDALAAQVSQGYTPTRPELRQLILTARTLYAERRAWPHPRITTRLKRTAKTGSKATPTRYGYVAHNT